MSSIIARSADFVAGLSSDTIPFTARMGCTATEPNALDEAYGKGRADRVADRILDELDQPPEQDEFPEQDPTMESPSELAAMDAAVNECIRQTLATCPSGWGMSVHRNHNWANYTGPTHPRESKWTVILLSPLSVATASLGEGDTLSEAVADAIGKLSGEAKELRDEFLSDGREPIVLSDWAQTDNGPGPKRAA